MSKLLHLTNRLKAQASWDMLTPGQHTALSELEKHWPFPDRINLFIALIVITLPFLKFLEGRTFSKYVH